MRSAHAPWSAILTLSAGYSFRNRAITTAATDTAITVTEMLLTIMTMPTLASPRSV